MPTLHWCNEQGSWFSTPCPNRTDEHGIVWSTFVSDDYYEEQLNGYVECPCSILMRQERKPVTRRLP